MADAPLQRSVLCACLCGLTLPVLQGAALAQNWTARRLHPPTWWDSHAYASDGSIIVGEATGSSEVSQAMLWDAETGNSSVLTPSGYFAGSIRAASGGRQGGVVRGFSGGAHAGLWSGSAQNFQDLHPTSDSSDSVILGMDAQQQVGFYRPSNSPEGAALWAGSAASFVSLHPGGTYTSWAQAVSGGQQGGFYRVTPTSSSHAALWSGTAESMTDLHPAGALESAISGMAPGQQVGWSTSPVIHAAMWHGTAGSYMDMNPPGAGLSVINATCGSAQAGYADFAGVTAAVVWFGSPDTFVRLDAFLPTGSGRSEATGISEVDGLFYVSGYAGHEAWVWIGVPAPGAPAVLAVVGTFSLRRRRGDSAIRRWCSSSATSVARGGGRHRPN